jgi:hypothetical protein
MSHKRTLKAFLELKPSLPPFAMNMLNLLMCRLRTHAAVGHDWIITANYRTNCIVVCVRGAVAMSIVFKRDLAVMHCTAWATNSNSINNYDPDFFPILVDT